MSAKLTTRDDWISAGLEDVAAHGIDGLSIERIASRLQVSRIGFYQRFRNRNELVDAIVDRWFLDVEQLFEKAAHIDDPIEQLRFIGYEALTNVELRALDRAFLLAAPRDDELRERMLRTRNQTITWADRLLQRGGLRPGQARRRAELLFVGWLGHLAEVEAMGGHETERQLRGRIDRLIEFATA